MTDIPAASPVPSEEMFFWGDEAEIAQLASQNGHDEAVTLRLFRRLRGPREALRDGNNTSLRDHLVMAHASLVEHCARGFIASGEPLDDLVQEGYVGLIKAVDRFDPEKGIKFSTYACHLIAGEIRHYLRDLGRMIHEPGWHFELRSKIARATENLAQEMDRGVSPEEIAAHLGIKVETVREVQMRAQTLHVESLDSRESAEESEGKLSLLEKHETERGGQRHGEENRVDATLFLEMALPQLKDLEQRAVRLFFFEELSKSEIARQLDISVNYVSYLVKRGTESLRRLLEESENPAGARAAGKGLAQQRARAAYLLEITRGEVETDARRSYKPKTRVPALSRPGVASLTQFAGWIDEETTRTARYGGQFSVLWCQIENWSQLTESLSAGEKRAASSAVAALVQKQCRNVDKLASIQSSAPAGLHFLVLLPATGGAGQGLEARLRSELPALKIPFLQSPPRVRLAYVIFPGDGESTDQLFAALGKKLAQEARC